MTTAQPTCLEVVRFKLLPGVTDEAFLAANAAMPDVLKRHGGFRRRVLSKGANSAWTDVVKWENLALAHQAAKQLMAEPALQKAAASLLTKIDRAIPASRRTDPQDWGFAVDPQKEAQASHPHLPALRRAVREKRKLRLIYQKATDQMAEERQVRPLQIEFWGWAWTLTTWCELRGDFRVFRADRILSAEILPDNFADEPGQSLMDYLRLMAPPATSRHNR